jgi:hypothetical protein
MHMRVVAFKTLLVWSVLLGVLPADCCVLKLAGICGCEARERSKSDCCHNDTEQTRSPLTGDHKNCCAYTPAENLVANASVLPAFSAYEIPPTAFELALTGAPAVAQPDAVFAPSPPHTPLYLRTHAILV